jgi:hypothetical protein
LVQKCAQAQAQGKITADRIRELCVAAGAPDLMALNSMAHLIPNVDTLVDAELIGK